MTDLDQLSRRVDQLEGVVRSLYPVVQQLRAEVAALRGVSPSAPSGTPAPTGAVPTAAVPSTASPSTGVASAGVPSAGVPSTGVPSAGVASAGVPSTTAASAAPGAHAAIASTPRQEASGDRLGSVAAAGSTTARARAASATVAATSRRDDVNLEAAVGRYGTLALATVTILLGVGAFVQWAIARGLLGPAVRVGLGLLGAGAVAAFGMRLRSHGNRRFGHIMLALALAIVHVDAWGAGPMLQLVPSPVALAGVAVASAALAWLALTDAEPTIFSVGVGGALLAPFVTSSGEPHLIALLTFGYLVIAASVWAVRERGWAIPVAIVAAGSVVYTAAAAEMSQADWTAPAAFLPSAFAIACAMTGLVVLPARRRSTLAQGALVALAEALARLTAHGSLAGAIVAIAATGTVIAYASIPGLGNAAGRTWFGACLLPVWLVMDAVWAVPWVATDRASTLALWALGAALAAAWYGAGERSAGAGGEPAKRLARALTIALAGLEGGATIAVALGQRHPVLAVVLLSGFASALAGLAARYAWPSAIVPICVELGVAAIWAGILLAARADYAYRPFLTRPSAAAAAAVAGWAAAVAALGRASWMQADDGTRAAPSGLDELFRWLQAIPVIALFLWIRQELSGAVSSDVSTFLLIAYYAAFGVTAVFVGRTRGNAPLRHAGLGVAVYAAIKAVGEAAHLSVALRIGSYLLAGAFLLAVAYWYRASDPLPATAGESRV